MSIRLTILTAILPIFGLVIFLAGTQVLSLRSEASTQSAIMSMTRNADIVGDLIQELQKERGFSAGFTASRGSNFAKDLPQQRAETDAALQAFMHSLPPRTDAEAAVHSPALKMLEDLSDTRAAIDRLDLSVPTLAAFFTGVINTLMADDTRARLSLASDSAGRAMEARHLIALAKESAGLERAMGATLLGSESFNAAAHKRFAALGGKQQGYLSYASQVLGRDDIFERLSGTPDGAAAKALRARILDLGYGGERGGATAKEWFAVSTAWIDLLRGLELELSTEIAGLSGAASAEARSKAITRTVMVALGIVATVLIALALTIRSPGGCES